MLSLPSGTHKYLALIKKGFITVLWVIGFGCVLGAGGLVTLYITKTGLLEKWLEWIKYIGLYGNFVLMAGLAAQGIPFAMGYIPLLLSAGFLYGFWLGMGTVFCGTFVGQHLGYWLSKSLFRKKIKSILRNSRPEVTALVNQVNNHQIKLSFLLRLTPIPFGFQNSILAVSQIPYAIFTVTSPAGMAVEQVLMVYLGTQFRDIKALLSGHMSYQEIGVLLISLGATVGLFVFFAYIGKKVIADANAIREQELNTVGVAKETEGIVSIEDLGWIGPVVQYEIPEETEIQIEVNDSVEDDSSDIEMKFKEKQLSADNWAEIETREFTIEEKSITPPTRSPPQLRRGRTPSSISKTATPSAARPQSPTLPGSDLKKEMSNQLFDWDDIDVESDQYDHFQTDVLDALQKARMIFSSSFRLGNNDGSVPSNTNSTEKKSEDNEQHGKTYTSVNTNAESSDEAQQKKLRRKRSLSLPAKRRNATAAMPSSPPLPEVERVAMTPVPPRRSRTGMVRKDTNDALKKANSEVPSNPTKQDLINNITSESPF